MPKALVNARYQLQKYPGKGGWTYVVIPEITPDKRARFGWVRVNGTVDGYAIKNYNLMPMANGSMFLPVKALIRKKIAKEAGDFVHVILFADNEPLEIPQELLTCLKEEPQAYKIFMGFTQSQQKGYINWILEAKSEQTKADRIAKTISRTLQGLDLWAKPE